VVRVCAVHIRCLCGVVFGGRPQFHGLSVIVDEMAGAELKSRFIILACRQHGQHRRAIARFGHYTFAKVILISGHEKAVDPVSVVSINLGIRFYGVETGDAGESIEPEESH
jgi:hypothetical protein